jgi:rhodanese-related sulfurtransferase
MPLADWAELDQTQARVVDVRENQEFTAAHIPKATNLPLSQMRQRYTELPKDTEIWTCWRNLSGGYTTYKMLKAAGMVS